MALFQFDCHDFYFDITAIFYKFIYLYPNVAKAGALQSQGTKGDAVALYCDPLVTPDMKRSGFPEGRKT